MPDSASTESDSNGRGDFDVQVDSQTPRPGVVAAGPVLAYNGIHLLLFLGVGGGAAWLVRETELHPIVWYVSFFVVLGAVFLGVLLLLIATEPLAEAPSAGSMVGATVLAGGAMAAYFWRCHRDLERRIAASDRGD